MVVIQSSTRYSLSTTFRTIDHLHDFALRQALVAAGQVPSAIKTMDSFTRSVQDAGPKGAGLLATMYVSVSYTVAAENLLRLWSVFTEGGVDDAARLARMRKQVRPVQITGDAGDCIFTHHRLLHSAGSNCSDKIRMAAFSDYEKVRPPAPICWRVNGREMLPGGGFSRYGLSGGEPLPPPTKINGLLEYTVPWWDDNLEFAPTHAPDPDDMWVDWNLGKAPPCGNVINTRSWRPPIPTPIYKGFPPDQGTLPKAPLPTDC